MLVTENLCQAQIMPCLLKLRSHQMSLFNEFSICSFTISDSITQKTLYNEEEFMIQKLRLNLGKLKVGLAKKFKSDLNPHIKKY